MLTPVAGWVPTAAGPVLRTLLTADLPGPHDARWHDLLTPAELAYCTGLARVAEHLAARAAGKQAVRELLGMPPDPWPEPRRPAPDAGHPPGHDVAILRVAGSAPRVVLAGAAQWWQRARGLPLPGVSLSHAAGQAAALAWLPAP